MTLAQLARRTRISESTLRGYLRREAGRIPAQGVGRKRRYPESAIPVVRTIKQENLQRKRKQRIGFYTLKDISRITGISQTTLNRYQRIHGDAIPVDGQGRKRMYPKEAIRLFRHYRKTSKRGPAGAADRMQATNRQSLASIIRKLEGLEKLQRRTNRLLAELLKERKKPRITRIITQ